MPTHNIVSCRTHSPWMCCHSLHMTCGCMGKIWQTWDRTNTLGSWSSNPHSNQALGPEVLVRNLDKQCHLQSSVGCYMKHHWPWICCHQFHILYGCMYKVGKELGTQSTQWDPVHHCLRAYKPKLWYQSIRWELQKYHEILRMVYILRWITTCHWCVATHSRCHMGALGKVW